MSRRRKHGDSPAAKSTPRRAAAAEESMAAASSSRPRRRQRREDGKPEERYETPRRVLKMDLSCTFSSPNDQDGQNDIFWDQNSPMTKQLGKGRKDQISLADSDEISHIVNRIAPQDEKPVTDSMLGVWIGATAIPSTPNVAKEQSRVKVSCTKLKTQNREKELMKLAEQFDKNMEELDVIQEQNKRNCDSVQTASETETLQNCKDYVQKQSCDIAPSVIKMPMKGNSRISVANDSNSNQELFDPSAEAAFNAIFDGSTQKCNGLLSQDMSDALLTNSDTTFGKKSVLKEEKNIANETLVTENLPNKTASLCPQIDSLIMSKSHVTPHSKQPEDSKKHVDVFTSNDFEEDWESLLGNEPFVLNAEMLELFPSTTAQVTDHQGFCTILGKRDKDRRTNINLDDRLSNSRIAQDLPSNIINRQLIDADGNKSPPNPNDKPSKLPFTRSKMKFEKSFNNIVIQDKIQDYVSVSNLTKEDCHLNLTCNAHALDKSGLNTRCANEKKYGLSFNQSFKSSTSTNSLGFATLSSKATVGNPNQTNASKLGSVLDDWNDPSFANEIIEACHQLEATWEADDVDDDVLYQACDDIERLTQQENIKDCKGPESTLKVSKSSQHGARSLSAALKWGSRLMPSKPSNLGSISVQTSLTNKSQISIKMEKKEPGRSYQGFSGALTNVTVYSKNSSDQINNLQKFCNSIAVPIQRNSPKSADAESSSLNVRLSHMNTELATNKKCSAQPLSHSFLADGVQSNRNKTGRLSKFTFTKIKNCQFLSQFNQDCITGNVPAPKITADLETKRTGSSFLREAGEQQSLMKCSGSGEQQSLMQPSGSGEQQSLMERTGSGEQQSLMKCSGSGEKQSLMKHCGSGEKQSLMKHCGSGEQQSLMKPSGSGEEQSLMKHCGSGEKQSLMEHTGSGKLPSREEEEKNRKCSPEEIQRKRQEALVRRMARARTSSVNSAPT